MKKVVALFLILIYATTSFSQSNLWRTFYERAIAFYENKDYRAAEKQFKHAQQLLLTEYGLNDATHSTYCQILYRRAHNLYMIDGMTDSSYFCFKELYELSRTPVDTIGGNWYRVESTIMLSFIDLDKGNIRECCTLLENERQTIDHLDFETRLPHKYYFYKNLAKTYENIIVNLIPNRENDFHYLNSEYVIVRDASFYKEYISVYKELVNLSYRFNKDDLNKKTEDLILLAEHCRLPDDDYLAEKTYERAFSMWKTHRNHNDITYLRLCKSYLSYCNNGLFLNNSLNEHIKREFDSIILADKSLSYIDAMDFFSVRIQDKTLNNLEKKKYITRITDELIRTDNYIISYYIVDNKELDDALKRLSNRKTLIKYLSLAAIYYYEEGEERRADLLLNKAKFFSLLLPDGDRLLLEEFNDALAKSAEIIGDEETYYSYKAINFGCDAARGRIPNREEWLEVSNHGDIDTRIANIEEGIKLFGDKKYDKGLIKYYVSLANAYLEKGLWHKADENIAIADSSAKLIEGCEASDLQKIQGQILLCKAKSAILKGDFANAQIFATEANKKGESIESLQLLADLSTNDRIDLDSIVSRQYEITKSYIQGSYPFLSERERIAFSQSRQFDWFSNIPRYADKYPGDTVLLSMAYNSALISKGTNISVAIEIINKARDNREKSLSNFYKEKTTQAGDTNERVRNNRSFYLEVLEKEMQHQTGVSSQYLAEYFGNWGEIMNKLSESEMAIEFVEYVPIDESNMDSLWLGALYITKNQYPQIVKLCNISEIENIKAQYSQNGIIKVYENVWEPILRKFHNVSRIWFSPSFHLFQINIESALPDSIESYRVSSTRNISKINDAPDYSKIALFGGLNYDVQDTVIEDIIANYTAYNIIRGSNINEERVGLTYLRGSNSEVTIASNTLSPVSQNIQSYTDIAGTEGRFKGLSGQGVSLLHIATHGLYIKDSDAVSNIGNRIMRQSGLFMSGAKAIWKGTHEKYSGDDGILLSEEIETIDFSNLNLVVLSACGTGLGSPTNDGVYGLQRAFKKAGAQTIIMSLWNVDDNATALMMETFYQELVKTNSKHQAFKKAQKAVRETYENPSYWAAFIMLD